MKLNRRASSVVAGATAAVALIASPASASIQSFGYTAQFSAALNGRDMAGQLNWCNYFHVVRYDNWSAGKNVTITLYNKSATPDSKLESFSYSGQPGAASSNCWPGHRAQDTYYFRYTKTTDSVILYADGTVS